PAISALVIDSMRPRKSGSHRLHAGGSRIRTCMGLFLSSDCFRFIASSLFGAGKAVLRPVACDQVRGARGRGQGTETLAKLGGLPASVACVSQRPRPSPGQALTPEHAEGRWTGDGPFFELQCLTAPV